MPFKYLWCFFIMDSSCGLCETHETPCNRNIKGQWSSCPSGNYAFVGSQLKSTDCGRYLFSFLNPNNASKQTAKKYLSKMSRWLYSLHIVCWTPLEEAYWAANESQPCGSSTLRTPAGNRIAPPLFGESATGHGDRAVVWEQLAGQGSSKVQRTGKINVGRHHEGRNRFLVGLKENVFAFCKATGHWKSENWETGNCFYKYTCISTLSQLFRSIFRL